MTQPDLKKKPAHEIILNRLDSACLLRRDPEMVTFAANEVMVLCSILREMVIPDAARQGVIERLRKIYEANTGVVYMGVDSISQTIDSLELDKTIVTTGLSHHHGDSTIDVPA